MKKKIFLIFIVGFILFLTGCTTKYDNNDIDEYIKELDVFKVSSNTFKVSKESFSVVGEDGYKDKVWTVDAKVDGKKIVFYVIDDYYYGTESVTNKLRSTYNYQAYIKGTKDIDMNNFVFDFSDSEYSKENNKNIDSDILKELNIGINNFALVNYYENLNDFNNIIDEVNNIVRETSSTEWRPRLCFNIYYESEYRNNVDDFPLREADFSRCYSSSFDVDEVKNEVKKEYITMNLSYRFFDVNNMFSKDEIADAVSTYPYRLGIADNSIEGYTLIDDLIQCKYSGVSFGTLYELLKRDSQNVVGTPVHFTYYKDNGDVYEFSYSFNDMYFEKSEKYGYYYILNGEKIKMGAYFYNYFRIDEVEKITGIKLVDVHYNESKGFYTYN